MAGSSSNAGWFLGIFYYSKENPHVWVSRTNLELFGFPLVNTNSLNMAHAEAWAWLASLAGIIGWSIASVKRDAAKGLPLAPIDLNPFCNDPSDPRVFLSRPPVEVCGISIPRKQKMNVAHAESWAYTAAVALLVGWGLYGSIRDKRG
eukprot:CAMPEP_0178446614 /NCGR_PEP_ID=MMETSP0689_2-20121128/40909_1 /TAXON_ID=160604 /ORGANISM="Amphidinium massartii, Strain CS-259" /LENGTH=147 /DNA_ID=CAMNT_0020071473 /DNA_START=113 /DNA_END=556 /DNA_ORIENTATION=-